MYEGDSIGAYTSGNDMGQATIGIRGTRVSMLSEKSEQRGWGMYSGLSLDVPNATVSLVKLRNLVFSHHTKTSAEVVMAMRKHLSASRKATDMPNAKVGNRLEIAF